MAQNSAHVTQTLQPKPSIFELVAADSLQSTFYPALKRIAHFLANLNPIKFGWMCQYYDEVYLCLNATIQQHYIRVYGGSLAEVFYSLTRVRTNTETLSKRDKFLTFLCVVVLPYIHTKLDSLLVKWNKDCDIASHNYTSLDIKSMQRQKMLIKMYSNWKTIYDCFQMVQFIAYLADRSKTHSLLNRLVGLKLNYLPSDINMEWSDLFTGKFRNSAIFTGLAFRALELSAFFLQFIQWWQTETINGSVTNLPIPDAPSVHANGVGDRYQNVCPICLQKWKIPTVNRISGYVYCYKCIVKHFNSRTFCPVTNYPSSIDDLMRIYDM